MSGQERREQLLDVGRRLFGQKGFEAVSVEENPPARQGSRSPWSTSTSAVRRGSTPSWSTGR
jgi:hypothetical protein